MGMANFYLQVFCFIGMASNIYVAAQCFEAGNYDGNAGIDIDIAKISNIEDPESCQKECQKNSECKFWTYNSKFASWRFGRKKCWLQNANAPESPGTCTTCTRGPRDCPVVEDICLDIEQDKVFQEFQNWGKLYTVDFQLTIKNVPKWDFVNVFWFTDDWYMGKEMPGLSIYDKEIWIVTSIGEEPEHFFYDFELGKKYHITVKQFKASGTYWYEVIIDGESKFKKENTQPQAFPDVKLYTSAPHITSFSSEMGSLCNLKIQQGQDS